jgi:hypothetical protein
MSYIMDHLLEKGDYTPLSRFGRREAIAAVPKPRAVMWPIAVSLSKDASGSVLTWEWDLEASVKARQLVGACLGRR